MQRYSCKHTFDVLIDEKVLKELKELGLEQHFEGLLEDLCYYAQVEDLPTNMYLVRHEVGLGEDVWWDDNGGLECVEVLYAVRGIDQFDIDDQGFKFERVVDE